MKVLLYSGSSRLVIRLLFLLCATAAICSAQIASHAPDGGAQERIQSVTVLAKTGAPFSAVVVAEWTRLLEDGTTTTIRNHRTIARDSTGRIFEERRYLTPKGEKEETRLTALEYTDPNRHEFYNCAPRTLICIVSPYHRPATVSATLPASANLVNGTVTREDLGQRTIEDLDALGSREITTINAGEHGYQHAEPTVKEFWYSPRLEINLIIRRFEPRGGAENFTVQNINLNEPDPKLFTPPSDYKIVYTDQ
jgi:hypothetical protein